MNSLFQSASRSFFFGPINTLRNNLCKRKINKLAFENVYSRDLTEKLTKDVEVYRLDNISYYARVLYGASAASLLILYGGAYTAYLAKAKLSGRGSGKSAQVANFTLDLIRKFADFFALGCLIVAAGGFAIAKLRVLRTVTSIKIRSGGERAVITHLHSIPLTQTQRSFEVPLKFMSCESSRFGKDRSIPIKLKGKRWKYLVDKSGYIPDPYLFDHTVGVERKF